LKHEDIRCCLSYESIVYPDLHIVGVAFLYCVVHLHNRFYSDDAAASNGGYRPASYCIELRGTEADSYGFMLPANQVGRSRQGELTGNKLGRSFCILQYACAWLDLV